MKRFYIDVRTNCIEDDSTLDITNLPPEMYMEFKCNMIGFYTETWCVGDNKYLDVNYSQIEKDSGLVTRIRDAMFNRYNVQPLYMRGYAVPMHMFDETLESQGYVKGEDY